MTVELLVRVIVPICVMIVMAAVGLNLRLSAVGETLRHPRSLLITTALQIVLLPVAALVFIALAAPPSLGALVILAIAMSPGGALTNVFTHLIGGNLALSVMMTTATTLLVSVSAPVVVAAAIASGLLAPDTTGTLDPISIAWDMTRVALLPIFAGLLVAHLLPGPVARLRRAVDAVCLAAIATVLVCSAIVSLPVMQEAAGTILVYSALFSLITVGIGLAVARLLPQADRSACAIEFAVRNLPVALVLASGAAPLPGTVAFVLGYFLVNTAILLALTLLRRLVRRVPA